MPIHRAKPLVIGLAGVDGYSAGVGKTTAAGMIVELCEGAKLQVVSVGLADRLKVIAQQLVEAFYGAAIPLTDYHSPEAKDAVRPELPRFNGKPFTLRAVLQHVGTEVFRRSLWADIWSDVVFRQYIHSPAPPDVLIIGDIRWPNEEAYWRRAATFHLIGIRRRACKGQGLSAESKAHQSETQSSQLTPDAVIDNDGTLDDLYDAVAQAVGPIIHKECGGSRPGGSELPVGLPAEPPNANAQPRTERPDPCLRHLAKMMLVAVLIACAAIRLGSL